MDDPNRLFQEASPGQLRQIFAEALDEPHIHQARLLDGGLFNTTYHVTYGKAREEAVLRLGPVNRHLLMGHEENLTRAEVHICALCEQHGIPSSHVLAWDCSRRIVDRDFMIVRYIPSVPMNQAELTEDERGALYREMGAYLRRFHQIEGDCYGYVSRILAGQGCSSWGDALLLEAEDILGRRKRRTLYRLFYALLEAYTPFEKYGDRSPYDNSAPHIKNLLAELNNL